MNFSAENKATLKPSIAPEGPCAAADRWCCEHFGREGISSPPHRKIMISAAESSGEIHGAALMNAARARGLNWSFLGLGGDRMAAAGARLLGHINDTAVMGLTEVAGSLPRILKIRSTLKKSLELDKPDALVLIDAPDFNFALAKAAAPLGIPVIYYICPQVWAWREKRLNFLKRYTSRRALLFDFEKKFYEDRGVRADWVGHPILDELPPARPKNEYKAELGFDPAKKLVSLMPGSRRKVVARLAPVILGAADLLLAKDPHLELALPRADSISPEFLQPFVNQAPARVRERLKIMPGRSLELLSACDLALLASGTSSVEATFLGTPQVVTYKVSALSYAIGRALISTPFVSIANLVSGRLAVPELLQDKAEPAALAEAAWPLLADGPARTKMLEDMAEVRARLGSPGASGRVLDIIAEELAAKGALLRRDFQPARSESGQAAALPPENPGPGR